MPVVMVSSLTERGCDTTLRALELGAVDFVTKPKLDISTGVLQQAEKIVAKVKAAASAKVRLQRTREAGATPQAPPTHRTGTLRTTHGIVAIGASTGGTEALREVLCAVPADAPGMVIVQHMPEKFTASFAARLNSLSRLEVREARDGDRVLPGLALLAPGDRHMQLVRNGAEYRVRIFTADPVNHHRPSVDVLFYSCAKNAGPNAAGIILTGMGNDGARGLLAMREAGSLTYAQDEATCVVFGMPKEAIALGGAAQVLPLERLASVIG
jgi:two-component system, chemotaxis family, protein-glutamate methylesterase/glutaminase